MKIGILTFHFAYNFGAVWQCYALRQALLRLGFEDVEVVNVVPRKWHWPLMGIPRKLSAEAFQKMALKWRYGAACRRAFDAFRADVLHCQAEIPMAQLPEAAKRFDAIVVGSDQVWTPAQRKDQLYFLDWEPLYEGRRVAYAPCATVAEVDEAQREKLCRALARFDALSARNLATQEFVKQLTGQTVPLVPDPTLLTDFSDLVGSSSSPNGVPYVLSFVLGDDIDGGNAAAMERIRAQHPEAEVIAIVVPQTTPILAPWADKVLYDVQPVAWLNWIAHAKLVYTDSFHCTIFAMKFHTPFVAYYSHPLKKSRFEDLSQRFGIAAHVATTLDEVARAAALPAADVDALLEAQREIGDAYLMQSLRPEA